MNWTKGLFRIWIVGASLWVLLIGFSMGLPAWQSLPSAAPAPDQSAWTQGKPVAPAQPLWMQSPVVAPAVSSTDGPWTKYAAAAQGDVKPTPSPAPLVVQSPGGAVVQFPAGTDPATVDLVMRQNFSPSAFEAFRPTMIAALGYPLGILAIGSGLLWAARGFQKAN